MTLHREAKRSLTGGGDLSVENLRTWLEGVPGRGIIRITEARAYPGEFGVPQWRIDVTWTEDAVPVHDNGVAT